MKLAILLLVLGCNQSSTSVPDAALDLTGWTARDCGNGLIGVPCPGHATGCPKKAWCDTSGAMAVCRCGDQSVDVTGDCLCSGAPDPAHPGCTISSFAGCP